MRRMIRVPLVLMLVFAACLAQVSSAAAGALNVRDDAGVLTAADQQTVRDSASRAPFSVFVWTVKGGYTGNKAGFVSAADALVTNNDTVVIAVDTVDKFSHVAARNARLTSAATTAAKTAADSSFTQSQWGAGVNAALGSLTAAVGSSRGNGAPVAAQSSFPLAGLILLVLVVAAVVAGVILLLRSRRRRVPAAGPQDGVAPGYGPGTPPYGQGGPSYGPGGPGYGGGPGQGRGAGMGGMLAGGAIGGIGGGLLGYELGKESGEHQGGSPDGGSGDQGQGGFVESDQGGGGADWGDGGGGGADFGGGGGSDF